MPEDLELTLESIHAEAGKWRRLADDLATSRAALARLDLGPDAFALPGAAPAGPHAALYEQCHDWFVRLLADAVTEFADLGDTLDAAAGEYADADARTAAAMRSIAGRSPEGR